MRKGQVEKYIMCLHLFELGEEQSTLLVDCFVVSWTKCCINKTDIRDSSEFEQWSLYATIISVSGKKGYIPRALVFIGYKMWGRFRQSKATSARIRVTYLV